jgi:hypothetical protein
MAMAAAAFVLVSVGGCGQRGSGEFIIRHEQYA